MTKNTEDSRNLEDTLPGALVDTSQIPNLFSNHDNGNRPPPPVNNTNHGGHPPMGQPGPPQGVTSKKGMLPMGPHHEPGGNMNLAQPTKMSPSSHQNPNDINPSANGSTGRKYQCKMCPQIYGSKADLQLHTQIHMRDAKPYKCSQCSKTFANSSYLSQHTRIHLGIKPYRCEICHRKFTQLSHLQQHIRTHTGDKPYKCRYPNCNKAFSQLSNLQSHSRCHQTDKPYKCNSCYKCFSDEISLLEHIPKHKESKHLKTHICQFCGKSYTQETYLAKHMQKHADRMEKHGMVLPPSLASSVVQHQLQPDLLWQKAIQAKVVDSVSMCEDGPNSSVAAMAAVVASQRRSMDSSLQSQLSLASLNSNRDNRPDHQQGMVNEHNDLCVPTTQGLYDTPMSSADNGIYNQQQGPGKPTSAFTPIQTGLLPVTSGNQLNISSSSRTYFPYDSINAFCSKSPEAKPTSFPNQLISLRQIRSYASMPTISGIDHPISLKSKGPT